MTLQNPTEVSQTCVTHTQTQHTHTHTHTDTHTDTHTQTYDVECEVAVAADLSCSVAGTAVVQPVVVRAGVPQGQGALLTVDLVSLIRLLDTVFVPLAGGPVGMGEGKSC